MRGNLSPLISFSPTVGDSDESFYQFQPVDTCRYRRGVFVHSSPPSTTSTCCGHVVQDVVQDIGWPGMEVCCKACFTGTSYSQMGRLWELGAWNRSKLEGTA